MAGSLHLAQELWDEIVDYLAARSSEAGYLVDLKSASLITRSCVARAQSYIFRSISVRNLPGVLAPIVAERLLQLLTASPHLNQYARELEVFHGDSEVMDSVAQIPWTSVYQLTLGPVDPTPGSLILEAVAVLVGLSSLRSLVFRSGRWDASQYFHIFVSCASGVKRLTFLSCRISPAVLHAMPKTAAKPTYLGIGLASAEDPSSGLSFGARAVHSAAVLGLLLESTCPLDLSELTHLQCSDFYDPEINGFLRRTTLTHLSIKERDHTLDHVDPNALPALTNIDVFDAHQPFNRFLPRLPAENRVAVITLITYGVTYDKHFESLLLGRSMPALNHVTIQVLEKPPDLESSHPSPPHAKTIRNYEAAFPTLHAEGLLSVEFIPLHCQPMLLEMASERLHRGRA